MMNNHKEIISNSSARTTNTSKTQEYKNVSFEEDVLKQLLGLNPKEIMEKSSSPVFLGVMIHSLLEERKKTSELLAELNKKYDDIMFQMKTQNNVQNNQITSSPTLSPTVSPSKEVEKDKYVILGEQDQKILKYLNENGSATAKEIKKVIGYKGLNGACNRLNKLYRQGHVKKVQSGKVVHYMPKE